MKIGIVVDGVAEFASLSLIYGQLCDLADVVMLRPVKADIQPLAPPGLIARKCESRIKQLFGRGADRVLVLFDRETRGECPGQLASIVEHELAINGRDVRVIVKNKTYENWLVADIAAVASGRFTVSRGARRAVEPNKADNVDALALLKKAAPKGAAYEKVADSKRILGKAAVLEMASHSRSFRRFLRAVECPAYCDQSRDPRP
jgi:hypothetical protein